MPFFQTDADAEERMLSKLIDENDEARQVHEAFSAKIELQKQLAAARKAEGLTQEDLAKKTGLSQQAISRVERGSGWTVASLLKYLAGIGYEVHLEKAH